MTFVNGLLHRAYVSTRAVVRRTLFWIRWLVLLPVSLGVAMVGVFLSVLVDGYAAAGRREVSFDSAYQPVLEFIGWLGMAVGGVMAMVFFISAAVRIAPARKRSVAWVAFALWGCVSLVGITRPNGWIGFVCGLPLGFVTARRLARECDAEALLPDRIPPPDVSVVSEVPDKSTDEPTDEPVVENEVVSLPPPIGEMVTIARYGQPVEAQIACARLEAEGIMARMADEQTVQANWLWSGAMGGVRVQVPASFVDQGRQVIANIGANEYALSDEDVLPDEPEPAIPEPMIPEPMIVDRADRPDAPGPAVAPFLYTPSAARFAFLSLVTLGFFQLYWLYRNFRVIDARSGGKRAHGVVMMFFMFLPVAIPVVVYLLARQVEALARGNGVENVDLPSATLAGIHFVLLLSLFYPQPYYWLYLLGFFALLPINSLAVAVNEQTA